MSSLQSRVLVAVIGVPVLVWVVLWAPSLVMMAALALLAGIGAMELQKCVSGVKRSELVGLSAICAVFTVEWYYDRPAHMALLFILEALIFFGYAIFKAGEVKFAQIMAGLFGSIAIGYSFAGFLRMESSGIHRAYLLLPFVLSFACDTFAYFAGRAFGKHKLAPVVSPHKTVEGAVGGVLGSMLAGCVLTLVYSLLSAHYNVLSIGVQPRHYLVLLGMGAVASVLGILGDLFASSVKRQVGIKDYGTIFPGHGGILDRFDSVMFIAPFVSIAVRYFFYLL